MIVEMAGNGVAAQAPQGFFRVVDGLRVILLPQTTAPVKELTELFNVGVKPRLNLLHRYNRKA